MLKRLGRGDEALLHLGLALKDNGDWPERLIRLTDPFVRIDGLVLAADKTTHGATATSALPVAPNPSLIQPMAWGRDLPAAPPAPTGAGRRQRVVLIYPPPWKIPAPQETLPNDQFAPRAMLESAHLTATSRRFPMAC